MRAVTRGTAAVAGLQPAGRWCSLRGSGRLEIAGWLRSDNHNSRIGKHAPAPYSCILLLHMQAVGRLGPHDPAPVLAGTCADDAREP